MKRLEAFGRFLYDFVIGDDWRLALGVVIAISVTAIIGGTSVAAWWILPLAVALLLALSVWTAARKRA
jgi:hypothetical protein